MELPSELHLHIASFLIYPDALALKHSSRHFYRLVYTGVHLKVDWLVERFERKLECPMERCSFRTDEAFCNGRIRRIMERRRRHLECRRVVGGCTVLEGQTCQTDLLPSWFKEQGRRVVVEYLAFWGREGSLLVRVEMCNDTWLTLIFGVPAALITAIAAILLEIVWAIVKRYDVKLARNSIRLAS